MHLRNGALLCLLPFFAATVPAQTIGGCPVFPANNIWNARVDTLPVHGRSAAWVSSISSTATLHQDFGGELYNGVEPGMPITLVNGSQPKVPITFTEGGDESDPGPYPIPPNAKVEPGSDAHVLVVDTTNCLLYETYASVKNPDNSWTVSSGAIFDLRKNLLRPQTWTSADAAGLPIMPGLARYEEILEGEIRHALRFTAPRTTREYLWPARHFASYSNDLNLPPMGARFRLKANFDVSSFSPTTQIILNGLKRYGMMLADNGSSWFIQGTFDPRWPNLADEWRRIPGSAFEAVDTSGLMDDIDSAAVRGTVVAPTLSAATVTPASVAGGQNATVRVTLSGSAPAGGVQVTLASSNGAVAPIAPSVSIPESSSSVDVPVTTSAVASTSTVTFTATLAGVNRQAVLTVNPPAATLQSAAFLVSPVTGGQAATLRLSLSGAAGAGGVTVSLVSANTGVATVPGSVQIPSGASSADVPVTTAVVQARTVVTFTVTYAGVSQQASLTVDPAATTATLNAASLATGAVTGGVATTLAITLTQAAPSGGLVLTLMSSNPGAASVPGSVSVPAGSASVQVPVTTFPVASAAQATLTVSYNGASLKASLTVNPPAVASLAVSPGSVQGGAGATGTVTLNGSAPAGGLSVALSSANTTVAGTPGSVQVAAGQSAATFAITTQPVTSSTTVQIRATAQGVTATASLGVTAAPTSNPELTSVSAMLLSDGRVRVSVELSAAISSGEVNVKLASNNNRVLNLGGRQVTVNWGASSGSAVFAAQPASTDATVVISATLGKVTKTTALLIPKAVVTSGKKH